MHLSSFGLSELLELPRRLVKRRSTLYISMEEPPCITTDNNIVNADRITFVTTFYIPRLIKYFYRYSTYTPELPSARPANAR